jgi:hypothetical protein
MRSCNVVRPSAGDIDRAVASAIERVRARSGAAVFDAWGDPTMFAQVASRAEPAAQPGSTCSLRAKSSNTRAWQIWARAGL